MICDVFRHSERSNARHGTLPLLRMQRRRSGPSAPSGPCPEDGPDLRPADVPDAHPNRSLTRAPVEYSASRKARSRKDNSVVSDGKSIKAPASSLVSTRGRVLASFAVRISWAGFDNSCPLAGES